MLSRRSALRLLRNAAVLGAFPGRGLFAMLQQAHTTGDEEVFLKVMTLAGEEHLAGRPIGSVVEAVGRSFLGAPYAAHTLESAGEECLVINLREFDCTTFMENSLVLARCIKKGLHSFEDYRRELTYVRYRHGIIDGYPSRLHYMTDWMRENAARKVLRDMGKAMGGKRSVKKIDFMTSHTESYRQLHDPSFVRRISAVERAMSRRGFTSVPKSRLAGILDRLQSGDIIGTVTTMKGMDVSHTGLIARDGDIPRFLHAPLSGGRVTLTAGSIADYVGGNAGMTGIVIARPLEP